MPRTVRCVPAPAAPQPLGFFSFLLVICMGFKFFSWKSLLFMLVFSFSCVFDVICMGFLMVFADRPLLVGICVVFFVLFVFLMLCA